MRIPNPFFAPSPAREVAEIRKHLAALRELTSAALAETFHGADSLPQAIAIVAEAAARTLGLHFYDVQFRGALALARGRIAEMQTGEGKTLAARPPSPGSRAAAPASTS